MRCSRTIRTAGVTFLMLLAATGVALAQWDQAAPVPVTSGPDYDALGRRSLALDDLGTLHAVYSRGVGDDYGVYYVSKPAGQAWSEPEPIEGLCCIPGSAWLEVRKETGEAYVLSYRYGVFTVSIRRAGGWEYHPLAIPPEYGVEKYGMTIDGEGRAHVAMTVRRDDPLIWQLAYGYWDGSEDFHFQVFEYSDIPGHGLFSQPDIAVKRDGSVAIAYQGQFGPNILLRVAENQSLGGTSWFTASIDPVDSLLYSESIEVTPNGDLHVAFHENIEMGAASHVYYAVKRSRDKSFEPAVEIGGPYTGARPKMVVTGRGQPHVVFEETIGPHNTGRIIYATAERGAWRQSVLRDDNAFTTTLVLDRDGNGHLLYERQIVQMQDNDVFYYGPTTGKREPE